MISTYAFLDLETTGLLSDRNQPQITEISIIAVHRHELENPACENTPRVLNKLTIAFRPSKRIDPYASELTGE